jgi:HPt (histidine-containing phosphotransfer) domain-containing protein
MTAGGLDPEIEELWAQMRHHAAERVEVLDRALLDAGLDRLGEQLRSDANVAAHKLIGALGSYGRPTGSRAAVDAERALAADPVDVAALRQALTTLHAVVAGDVR